MSTQEVERVEARIQELSIFNRAPRIQQIGAQNWGNSGKLAPHWGGGGGLLASDIDACAQPVLFSTKWNCKAKVEEECAKQFHYLLSLMN